MSDYAFYLLLGSGAGAIIAAFALGLVVTYQGSGVVNFAHGAMAMWSTYVYADLRNGAYPIPIPGLPDRYHFSGDVGFRWALLITMLTAAVIGFVVYALVFRPLRRAPALAKVVASIGLVIMFISLVDRRFADQTALRVKPILPREPVSFTESITVPRDGLWLATVVVLLCAFFWLVGKFTRVGLATKAAAENEKAAVLLGYSPDRLAALGWVMASMSGALVGVLASPQLQLNGTVYTFGFLIPALGAALIGKFQRFWPTLVAGMAIGMVQSTFTKMQSDFAWFPEYGAREGLPFLVIIVTMVVLGERLPERGSVTGWKLPSVPAARLTPVSFVVPFAVAIAALFLLGPLWRAAIMTTVVAAVLSLSMVVLVGFGGQTSLAQMAFAGVAGFALSKLATDHGVPFPLAPLLAATGAALFGVLVGLPALRVRGTNLAIVTLAGGVMVAEFVFKNPDIIGDVQSGGAKVPNPSLGSWDFGLILGDKTSRPIFGVFLVLVLAVFCVLVANVRRGGAGRVMLAVRGNERASAAVGIDVTRVKIVVFAFSSFIAGVGGTLIAYRFGSVSDLSYGTMASLTLLSFAYLGGITSVSGAVTAGITASAGVAFYGLGQISGGMGTWEAFIGGSLLIVTAVSNPEGIAGAIRARADRRRSRGALVAASR